MNGTVLSLGGKTTIFTKNETSDGIKWSGANPDFIDSITSPILLNGEIELTLKKSGELGLKLTEKLYKSYDILGTISLTFKKTAPSVNSASASKHVKSSAKLPRRDGFMWIGGCGYGTPYVLDGDCSGTGWSWDYGTSTLSLNSGYTCEPVFVSSYEPTTLNITGEVTINGGDLGVPFRCYGDLEITGSARVTASAKGTQGTAIIPHCFRRRSRCRRYIH